MKIVVSEREYFKSIDYLRVIAMFLITNSHFAKLYPKGFERLSFGGMFGDCLFFFISGYCLIDTVDSFYKYMKRRFIRIYIPYIICILLLLPSGCFAKWNLFDYVWPIHTYTFLPCIITIYPLFYICIKGKKKKHFMEIVLLLAITVELLYFFLIFNYKDNTVSLTADYSFIQLISFFVAMILGGISRKPHLKLLDTKNRKLFLFCGSIAFFAIFALQSVVSLGGGVENITLVICFWFCLFFCKFYYLRRRQAL